MTRTEKLQLAVAILIVILSMLACDYSTAGMNDTQLHNWIAGATWTPAP